MSIFARLKNLISGYFNKAIESMEDPDIMIDQYIHNLTAELGKVKGWTADAVVVAKKCKANVDGANKRLTEVNQLLSQAEAAGNAEDVYRLSSYKTELEDELAYYMTDLAVAEENEQKMRSMHEELTKKLGVYMQKRNVIKSRIAVAKTYNLMTRTYGSLNDRSYDNDFARMEEKANDSLLRADALLSLTRNTLPGIEDLKAKYSAPKAITTTA